LRGSPRINIGTLGPPTSDDTAATDEGSNTSETSATSDASSSAATSSSEGTSNADTGSLLECPADTGAALTLAIDPPSPNEEDEASEEHREAECTVSDFGGDAVAGWTLALSCDDDSGGTDIATTITITTADSPFAWVDDAQPIAMVLDRWSGFEVGSGVHLSLAQGGAVALVAFDETADGGLVGHCAAESDPFRATADTRLAEMDARVEPAGCADAAAFRLTREADGVEMYVYLGEVGDLAGGLVAVVEASRCAVSPNDGSGAGASSCWFGADERAATEQLRDGSAACGHPSVMNLTRITLGLSLLVSACGGDDTTPADGSETTSTDDSSTSNTVSSATLTGDTETADTGPDDTGTTAITDTATTGTEDSSATDPGTETGTETGTESGTEDTGSESSTTDDTGDCDPSLVCGEALTCVDGQLYPTTCGPENCDEPIGPCDDPPPCDPNLICGDALTCVDNQLYPTTCGPGNCDEPIGACDEPPPPCDPELICGAALTCVEGLLYPTTCGPTNCDEPIGEC